MQLEVPEAMRVKHFPSHLQKDALQIFRNINASNKQTLEDVVIIFGHKYVKSQYHKAQKNKNGVHSLLTLTENHLDFLEGLHECAE